MESVNIRMKHKVTMQEADLIKLNDLAYIDAPSEIRKTLEAIPIHQIKRKDGEFIVIESFMLLSILRKVTDSLNFDFTGPGETIIEVKEKESKPSILFMLIIWIILFIGTAMSLINFHYDVSMPEVHSELHFIFTGEQNERPLWIQIPYSFGLAIGMILFLNHWFKRRINEEPSPLEIELFKYERDLHEYVRHYENELNNEERHF